MKRLLSVFVLCATVLLGQPALAQSSSAAKALKPFVGTYRFSEDGGATTGGTPVYVEHELVVSADGSATLRADGYQTARDLICSVTVVSGKLKVSLLLYNADGTNLFTPYNADDLLFTLEKRTVKGKSVIWTNFSKYAPAVFAAKKGGGVYFVKS